MTDRELAEAAAIAGGRAALPFFRAAPEVELKAGGAMDPVSEADRASEAAVVALLEAERPADGVLGEEGTDTPGDRRWVVDGLDGTLNFLRGMPAWCVALAVSGEDGPLASAVYDPVAGDLFSAGRGEGAFRNGERFTGPAQPPELADAIVMTYLDRTRVRWPGAWERWERLYHATGAMRIIGSGSLELSWVATGRYDAWAQAGTLPWDWLPGALLIEEAGGAARVIDAPTPWHLAGPAPLVDALAELLA